jgi:DNA-binding XRE family transcriptional regulator
MGGTTRMPLGKTWLSLSGHRSILILEGMIMHAIEVKTIEPTMGTRVKRLRLLRLLTQQELADEAGVSRDEVDCFEQGLPVILNSRRKILKELWADRAVKV